MNKKINKIDLFKNVKLLILDVDGVLTKGEIIYDSEGREFKVFNVKDGLGIYILSKFGIPIIFLSAKDSEIIRKRAQDLGVSKVIAGILPKESVLENLISEYNVKRDEICFIGDDLIDLGLIEKVGIGVAVNDAISILKKRAKYITKKRGGEGAVREVVDLILKAKKLEDKLELFLKNKI